MVEEIGGAQAGKFDVFSVSETATLAGALEVRLVDLGTGVFSPAAGDVFTILSATGGIIGQFDSLVLPSLSGDLAWKVVYGASNVSLVTTLPADYNGNGVVDSADYSMWRKTLGSTVPPGTGADGDFDGQVTQADYDVWRFALRPNSWRRQRFGGGRSIRPQCQSRALRCRHF